MTCKPPNAMTPKYGKPSGRSFCGEGPEWSGLCNCGHRAPLSIPFAMPTVLQHYTRDCGPAFPGTPLSMIREAPRFWVRRDAGALRPMPWEPGCRGRLEFQSMRSFAEAITASTMLISVSIRCRSEFEFALWAMHVPFSSLSVQTRDLRGD